MGDVLAIVVKEWRAETRARTGVFAIGLFGALAVVTVAYATFSERLSPTVLAGMLCLVQLFACSVALPRTFLAEEEQGTFDLLRGVADPAVVFVGKALFNLLLAAVLGLALSGALLLFTGGVVHVWWLLVVGLLGESVVLAAAVSLAGALAMGAVNRWLLAGAITLPLLAPQMALVVAVLRVALGEGQLSGGIAAVCGLWGFGVVAFAIGPWLAAATWRST